MSKRLCAVYARVSTDRQARVEDGGLDTQIDLMKRRVALEGESDPEHEWVLVDQYRDGGFSGKNLDRPELQRLKADVLSGRINTVIVQKIDRITRSLRDFYDLWEFFEKHGVNFLSLHERFDTTTAVGRAMLKLILVFAELEREQTSERTAATMEYRARQGLKNGGRIFGYKRDETKRGLFHVDPKQAEIVRRDFFELCLKTSTSGAVHRHLIEKGIRKPVYISRRGKQRGGTTFTKADVLRMLRNEFYVGKVLYRGKVYDGQHEPIVSEKVFHEVQRVLERNARARTNVREPKAHIYLLQGLLRCGNCGSMMTPKHCVGRRNQSHFYYMCVKSGKTGNFECAAKYVPAKAVETFVIEELNRLVVNEAEIREVIARANRLRSSTLGGLRTEEQQNQRVVSELDRKVERIVNAIEEGTATTAVKSRLADLEAKRREETEKLASVRFKREKAEEKLLSADVMLDTYRALPTLFDKLVKAEAWPQLKTLIANCIEVAEWHESPGDQRRGMLKVMLFEHAVLDGANGSNDENWCAGTDNLVTRMQQPAHHRGRVVPVEFPWQVQRVRWRFTIASARGT